MTQESYSAQKRCQALSIRKASSTPRANTKNGVTQSIEPKRKPAQNNAPSAVPHAMNGQTHAATASMVYGKSEHLR